MKKKLKGLFFRLLGRDPEAVVVTFLSGDDGLALAMVDEVKRLIPDRRHFAVRLGGGPALPNVIAVKPGPAWSIYRQVRRALGRFRVGIAPTLFTSDKRYRSLRRAAFLLAPSRVLAYNAQLERHHLRLRSAIASWLFLRGVALDRIFLRPRWLFPWKKDRSIAPSEYRILEGRPVSPLRRRVAVLSPYSPYPLSHGGAVRIYNLLREAASEFDIFLFAFTEGGEAEEAAPLLEFCAKVILVQKPRYREPRWSTIDPPEVCEYRSPAMQQLWERLRRDEKIEAQQVEYTPLASYSGDILVEHDVTSDLYRQVYERERTRSSWWDWWRWQRFETRAVRRFRRVVAMSDKDSFLLGLAQGRLILPHVRIVPNGVDLDRFRPEREKPGQQLLFIGSFRHFPNIVAYRFFVEQVWPLLQDRFPEMTATVVGGPDPLTYWREYTNEPELPGHPRIRLLEFVRDVRPLYIEANLVLVPTLISAGTNLKVLEAMAMERAVVSTPSGCAGLGLEHGVNVWVAETADQFAGGIAALIENPELRKRMARSARLLAEENFDWKKLGELQREVWREVASAGLEVRAAAEEDLPGIQRIQDASPEAVRWDPPTYLGHDCRVAVLGEHVAGFLVARRLTQGEFEILNLAVDPKLRRHGIARALLREALRGNPGTWFLEVRESNAAARNLYEQLGFQVVARRPKYYQDSGEDAVVLRIQSC